MAIALDTSANFTGNGTSKNVSYTVTGSNPSLLVGIVYRSDIISGISITYNGVALTLVTVQGLQVGNLVCALYALAGPATGTNTLSLTWSSSNSAFYIDGAIASYTGTKQSAIPDSSASTNTASGQSSITPATNVVAANCWLAGVSMTTAAGTVSNAGNTTVRQNVVGNNNDYGFFDSNGTVSTGSQTQSVRNNSGTGYLAAIVVSIAPNTNAYTQNLPETLTVNATVLKSTVRTLTESATMTAVLSAFRVLSQTFTESIAISAAVIKGITRTLAEAAVVAASITRSIQRTISEAATVVDLLRRTITRTLPESFSLADSIKKYINGLLAIYSDKFSRRNTTYDSKFTSQGTSYEDKYEHPQ